MSDTNPCPTCGALPCDQVNAPLPSPPTDAARMAAWEIQDALDVHFFEDAPTMPIIAAIIARHFPTPPAPRPAEQREALIEGLIEDAKSVLHHDGNDEGVTPADTSNHQALRKKFTARLNAAWQASAAQARPVAEGFAALLERQRDFSLKTFGPGPRHQGNLDHIRKECLEVEANPSDLEEWIDIAMLAVDGAWREGHSIQAIIAQWAAKQAKNESRSWPDWRTADRAKAIEHDRAGPSAPQADAGVTLSQEERAAIDHGQYLDRKSLENAEIWQTPYDCNRSDLLAIIDRLAAKKE